MNLSLWYSEVESDMIKTYSFYWIKLDDWVCSLVYWKGKINNCWFIAMGFFGIESKNDESNKRQSDITSYFSADGNLVYMMFHQYCKIWIQNRLNFLGGFHRLISKKSFEAVLLYNINRLPSIPIVHAVDMKDTYDTHRNFFWINCSMEATNERSPPIWSLSLF